VCGGAGGAWPWRGTAGGGVGRASDEPPPQAAGTNAPAATSAHPSPTRALCRDDPPLGILDPLARPPGLGASPRTPAYAEPAGSTRPRPGRIVPSVPVNQSSARPSPWRRIGATLGAAAGLAAPASGVPPLLGRP